MRITRTSNKMRHQRNNSKANYEFSLHNATPVNLLEEHEYQDLMLSPSSTLCTTSPALLSSEIPVFSCLSIHDLDTSPFSDSFSGLIEEELDGPLPGTVAGNADTSYDIKCFTNVGELNSEYDHQDVDEILVMRPKATSKLSTIEEESRRSGSIELPYFAEFEPLSGPQSKEQTRLYRKRNNGQIYTIRSFHSRIKPSTAQLVLNVVETLKSPFFPQVYCSFYDADYFYIVTEYNPRESLQDHVRYQASLKAEHAFSYASELIEAITSLHNAGIIHRNLNPETVMINSEGHIIIEGFEYSESLCTLAKAGDLGAPSCTKAIDGISSFSAPEILLNWAHEFSVDCWAFGLLLLFMLSGKHLIRDFYPSNKSWKDIIIYEPIDLTAILDSTARDLVAKCLERNPSLRLSVDGIRNHAYFSAVDWNGVATKRFEASFRCSPSAKDASAQTNLYSSEEARSISAFDCLQSRISPNSEERNDAVSETVYKCKRHTHILDDEHLSVVSKNLSAPSLLESSPKVKKSITPSDSKVHSTLTLHDSYPNPLGFSADTPEKMATFWQTLDHEESMLLSSSIRGTGMGPRPRKLRKSRSSFYFRRGSFIPSTSSPTNKLHKKFRSTNPSSVSVFVDKPPALELPNGVKQIGSGIGFTYNTPAATLSKVSICTDTPKGCHGLFLQRLLDLRFGPHSSSALAKARAKRTLLSLVISEADHTAGPGDFRGSDLSLAPPMSLDTGPKATSPTAQLGSSLLGREFRNSFIGVGFLEDDAQEVKLGDSQTTLRLVLPSDHKNEQE